MAVLLIILFAFQLVSTELMVEEVPNDISSVVKDLLKKVHKQDQIILNLKYEIVTMKKKIDACCSIKKKKIPTGKTKESPVKSCKWLKENYKDIESGLYWISLKEPTQVYCDMNKRYGGGWTLIGKVEIKSESEAKEFSFDKLLSNAISDLRFAHQKKFLLSDRGLRELQGYINFTQIRFYCHKAWHGRKLHIKTLENDLGKGVIDLITLKSTVTPKSCGSYKTLDDDNSKLGQECGKWKDGHWYDFGLENIKMYAYPFYIPGYNYFGLYYNGLDCDDDNNKGLYPRYIGEWAFYVR